MSKKRIELSLKEKINSINESNGQSQRKLAAKYGISKTQVIKIASLPAVIKISYTNF